MGTHSELCAMRAEDFFVYTVEVRIEGFSYQFLSLSYISHRDEGCKARWVHSFIHSGECRRGTTLHICRLEIVLTI
jgi:hypothetical protein